MTDSILWGIRASTLLFIHLLVSAAAQAQISSSLTISSEGGYKFYLYLDGRQMNERAESAMRVQGLTRRFYKCEMVFADKMLEKVKKKYLPVTDQNNINASLDIVYQAQSREHGKQILVYISQKSAAINATSEIPPGITLYNYGITVPAGTQPADASQEVHTRLPGESNKTTGDYDIQTVTAPLPVDISKDTVVVILDTPCMKPMSNIDYQSVKAAMNLTNYDEAKLKAAKAIIAANCVTSRQVAELCMLFDFEQPKLILAKYAYKRCYDRKNYSKVVATLRSDPMKAALNYYIMGDYPIPVHVMQMK